MVHSHMYSTPHLFLLQGSSIPLSYDSTGIMNRPGIVWTHEMASEMLFDYLVDDNVSLTFHLSFFYLRA
jgi:hypothetical protein